MRILSKRQILLLHDALIRETGGSPGLRDEGILESALTAPFQGYGDFTPYPTVQQKAARLRFGLVMDHPFVDGNKRVGAHVMLTLLALNGIELTYSQEELTEIVLAVAAGRIRYEELLAWVLDHQK